MTEFEPLNRVRPLPLRVEDFFLLDKSGAFEGYGKTELIDGGVVFMNAQHRPHARIKGQLFLALVAALREHHSGLTAIIEATVSMPPHNAPEPDLVLTSEPDGEGPIPLASVALLVEISDATLTVDLDIKARLYASHNVAEYWVVDVEGRVIHQHWGPEAEGYAELREVAFGELVDAATIAGLKVLTDGLG